MASKTKKGPKIHIERGAPDRILPKHFVKVFSRRFFPVLALTYLATLVGMAFKKGNIEQYLLHDFTVYMMALISAAWVSIPALLWITLRGSHLYNHVANLWYIICAGLMMIILAISFLLFPEADMYGVRIYVAPTIPMMFVMYYFLVKQPLSAGIAHCLTAMGLTALLFGVWRAFQSNLFF